MIWKVPQFTYKGFLIRLRDFLGLLKELLIFVIAFIIFKILSIIGFVYTLIKHVFVKFDYSLSRQLTPIIRAGSLVEDGMANATAGEFLNDVLKPMYVQYGKWYHTISAITGINQVKGDDKLFRKILDKVLGKKHSENAITNEQKCLYKINIKNNKYDNTNN